jgi:hypothetical protein
MRNRIDTLLIGGGFFGYAQEIAAALEEARNIRVKWFEDRPATDTLTKSLVRLAPSLVAKKASTYFEDIIAQVRHEPILDVLVIKGESLSVSSIHKLRAAFPQARFTLYFWDSYLNMPKDSVEKVHLFDNAFTFDPIDAQSDRRLRYRPLFFLDEYANLPKVSQDIDVLFFGTAHSDRFPVLNRLARALPENVRFEKLLYFPSRLIYSARHSLYPSFWTASRKEFIYKPLSKAAIKILIARSKVIVDIERQIQNGLTMRTIEMLGAGKKLVTTNDKIAGADFFNANNIAVIDRMRPRLDVAFLDSPYEPPNPNILLRYSLSGWLDEVLPNR